MATAKKERKVFEFEDSVKELSGVVRENVFAQVDAVWRLIDESQKLAAEQIEQLTKRQAEYGELVKSSLDKVIKDATSYAKAEELDRLAEIQREYVKSVHESSHRALNTALTLWRKQAESVLSTVDSFLGA